MENFRQSRQASEQVAEFLQNNLLHGGVCISLGTCHAN
jgi:hypothetical protein